MAVVSFAFALFVAAALLVYHLLPPAFRKAWLLLISAAFCVLCSWQFAAVLLLVILGSFALGGQIVAAGPSRRAWLWLGVVGNTAVLFALRYFYRGEPFAGPFVVVGLSFYSLQAMSYLFDLYSGHLETRGSLTDVALYLSYFPKLVAGPIERAPEFCRRVAAPLVVDDTMVTRSATLIAVGLTRKLVVADPLSPVLATALAPSPAGAVQGAVSIVVFAFVLYNDFAAYTSIVRGVSLLFGIELSSNFARPFFARSFTDFWNRWHITLSLWLRDYIYLPLTRFLLRRNPSLSNVPTLLLPPLGTMLASGLWHGSGLHMLLWAGLHAVYLIVERLLGLWRPSALGHRQPRWRRAVAALVVFTLACWAFVPFRLPVDEAMVFWRVLLCGPIGPLPDLRLVGFAVPSLWLDWMQERHGEETAFEHWSARARTALLAVAMVLWFLMTRAVEPQPFIYEGF